MALILSKLHLMRSTEAAEMGSDGQAKGAILVG